MLLIIWMTIGGAVLAWILISSMIPQGRPGQVIEVSNDLITGEMSDFELTFPPRGAPYTQFAGPDGPMTISDFRGQVVLVNLWATWCPPCIEELPWLDQLNQEIGGEDFQVVAIAVEPRVEERARAFLERLGVSSLELYTDETLQFATALGGADALPVSILYDERGREVGRLTGSAHWSSDEAKALIQAVIDGDTVR